MPHAALEALLPLPDQLFNKQIISNVYMIEFCERNLPNEAMCKAVLPFLVAESTTAPLLSNSVTTCM